ncbi:MAG: HlyD family efflux transporter periplasmic adaptor subunit, partial [Polymorphobacter sp.]
EALRISGFVSARRLAELRAAHDEATARAAATDAALSALENGARPDERRAAAAQSAAAAASTQALAAQLDKCTLRAPIAGTVLKLLRREGEFSGASAGTPIVVIGDLSSMIVRAELLDRDAAAVAVGQRADVWLDGSKQQWRGHVIEAASLMGRRTARSLDPSDRFDRDVREVLIAFDGASPQPLVGLRVNVGLVR